MRRWGRAALTAACVFAATGARADGYVNEGKCFGAVVPSVPAGSSVAATVHDISGTYIATAWRQACNTNPGVYALLLRLEPVTGRPNPPNLIVRQAGMSFTGSFLVKDPSSNLGLEYYLFGAIDRVMTTIVDQITGPRFDVGAKLEIVIPDVSVPGSATLTLSPAPGAPTSSTISVYAGNKTDMWWNSSESGTGLSIVHHGDNQLFVVWYTYDEAGNPLWLSCSGGAWSTDGRIFTGALYRTKGTSFGKPWNPSAFDLGPQYGTLQLRFDGPDTAVLTFTAGGASGTKTYTRLAF